MDLFQLQNIQLPFKFAIRNSLFVALVSENIN